MTRGEFINDIQYWSELIDFCWEINCYICEDIYDSEARDDYIDEDLSYIIDGATWRSVLDTLQDYERDSGYDYYYRDECGTFHGLDDDDFENYKNDVLDWADNREVWDEEEEEEDPELYVNPEDKIPVEAEDVSMDELFASGISALSMKDIEENIIDQLLTA